MTPSYQKLIPYIEKRRKLHYLCSILNYDMATCCPTKSLEEIGSLLSEVDVEGANVSKDPEFIRLVKEASRDPDLNDKERRFVEHELESIEYLEKLSSEEYLAMRKAYTKSNEMWRLYKPSGDFSSWLPYWEACVEAKKKECALKRKDGETLYDVCLRSYEPGSSEKEIDRVFIPLKAYLIPKVKEAIKKQASAPKAKNLAFPKEKQEKLSYALLKIIGYDLDMGALRESEHPFSDNLSRYDARITTNYDESDFRSSLFSVLHEGGHALEFQHWPEEQYEDGVEGFATAAICETHSRFYENLLGRSKAFVPTLRKALAETLDPSFASWSDEEIYALGNEVKPIANRCDSDELTYSLHIILRYEIEKELINGRISCAEVPAMWNRLTEEYLGVKIENDRDGCMQDIHWTDGEFGYFPSYALGNIYGAMILNKMKESIDVPLLLREGNLSPILDWLAEHDYPHDYKKPVDWIRAVTGRDMDSSDFIAYLDEKY